MFDRSWCVVKFITIVILSNLSREAHSPYVLKHTTCLKKNLFNAVVPEKNAYKSLRGTRTVIKSSVFKTKRNCACV